MTTSEITLDNAVNWFQSLAGRTPMPGARGMYQYALDALREKQERGDKEPCEYCKSGEYKQDGTRYMNDLYRFCPACGRRLKGEADD